MGDCRTRARLGVSYYDEELLSSINHVLLFDRVGQNSFKGSCRYPAFWQETTETRLRFDTFAVPFVRSSVRGIILTCWSSVAVGSLSIPLAKLGATVASSDISAAMTEEAAARAKVGCLLCVELVRGATSSKT